VCSLTVSTYLLSLLSIGAFLAAYRAARYAKEALAMEREVVLSLNACDAIQRDKKAAQQNPKRGKDRDRLKYLIPMKHEPHRCEERYLRNIDRGFEAQRPGDFNTQAYGPAEFDCASLGRSALINGALQVQCEVPNGGAKVLRIQIGSIPADQYVHLTLWIATDKLGEVDFRWLDKAIHREGNVRQQDVECNPREPKFGPKVSATTGETPRQPQPEKDLRVSL